MIYCKDDIQVSMLISLFLLVIFFSFLRRSQKEDILVKTCSFVFECFCVNDTMKELGLITVDIW